jgi:hypothetical protein
VGLSQLTDGSIKRVFSLKKVHGAGSIARHHLQHNRLDISPGTEGLVVKSTSTGPAER